ncbi:hypothetical protein [Clostridium sp.]|uniref:hypothetical protein n=1 Tax=Clostridium sp. TaxID=1506 RepID=UPI0026308006|nr:hypothetical protein [uncultured Clostridium sp.]
MKNINDLENALETSVANFRKEIDFDTETFSQSHNNDYLDKDDFDELGRQTFYALDDFKKHIIDYLKDNKNE